MLSQTRRALEDFDNQHEFERMAADLLNALGYSSVEPMTPRGAADGGRDIKFMEGDTPGVALVTLDKKIREKFKLDLLKQEDSEGVIALFCNVDVTPSLKLEFAKQAIAKGYRLEVFDIERLRSVLDASLKEIRRRYLKIDDEVAARLRSEVKRLLRFPDATADKAQPPTLVEKLLADQLPRRLFDLLMAYEERDILEVPGIGGALQDHLKAYYSFRQKASQLEEKLCLSIGKKVAVRFAAGWRIYLKYVSMRFAGASKETIIGRGDFLNYDITWDDAEKVFKELCNEPEISLEMSDLFRTHTTLCSGLEHFVA